MLSLSSTSHDNNNYNKYNYNIYKVQILNGLKNPSAGVDVTTIHLYKNIIHVPTERKEKKNKISELEIKQNNRYITEL